MSAGLGVFHEVVNFVSGAPLAVLTKELAAISLKSYACLADSPDGPGIIDLSWFRILLCDSVLDEIRECSLHKL